ncbi:RnfH family protein [Amphritea atlantica]|nr:RnfH family protein [Amphritea atlantica]
MHNFIHITSLEEGDRIEIYRKIVRVFDAGDDHDN